MAQQSAAIALLLLREWSMTFPLGTWHDERDAYQRTYFDALVRHAQGNLERMAKLSGQSVNNVKRTLDRHDLRTLANVLRDEARVADAQLRAFREAAE